MPDDDRPLPDSPASPFVRPALSAVRKPGPFGWVRSLIRKTASNSNNLQDAIEDYIEELKETVKDEVSAENQKTFIVNVLKTHDMKVIDVMVPRAGIVAISESATPDDIKKHFAEHPFSRVPIYRDNLDHIIGVLHIKDLLACLLEGRDCKLSDLAREVMIVTPGLPVMELFLMMREDKKHMALVVDEHGGIDGLVTLNDVIEAIVGDIEDEFDNDEQPMLIEKPDGSIMADARVEVEDFEERYGTFLSPDERESIETLGGLAFELAGRMPKRGEALRHDSGLILEVLDVNASRVTRVRVRNLPHHAQNDEV